MKTHYSIIHCKKISKAFFILLFCSLGLFTSFAQAQSDSSTAVIGGGGGLFEGLASITTDLGDYPPGSLVTITGSGWIAGETVTVRVTHNPISIEDSLSVHQPWEVVAGHPAGDVDNCSGM